MRLLICAGGTGGGVYPALSILQALASADSPIKAGSGAELHTLWVGGEGGMEEELVRRAGVEFKAIPAAGVHGVGLKALPGNLVKLTRGLFASIRILRSFRPQTILFTGGFVAVPMALAARLAFWGRSRPRSLVYIPDIEPGMALNALLKVCDQAALTTENSRQFMPARLPVTVTGYPLRRELQQWAQRSEALRQLNLSPEWPVLLVMGGSKGARSINQALAGTLTELLKTMQVVHLSGQLDWPAVQQSAQSLPADLQTRYHPYPYLHEEMGAALRAADLAVGRSGASCLGEFPLFGLPAVLVPYPFAWRYQKVNAAYLVEHGAAILLEDGQLETQLGPLVSSLMADPQRLSCMRQAMTALARPQAAHSIASLLVNLVPAVERG